jgi:hypothetical protein
MALIAKDSGGGNFELTPAGNHIGVCYMVCDLGDQETTFNGETKTQRKVRISWELPGELMSDGRPFSVSKNYTLSLSEKANLRKDLESWRGRAFTDEELAGFDLFNVLGKACMVNVIHESANNKTYAVVASVASLPKGMPAPKPINALVAFSLEDENARDIFVKLPDWLQQKINTRGLFQSGQQVSAQPTPPASAYADDADFDDIPF